MIFTRRTFMKGATIQALTAGGPTLLFPSVKQGYTHYEVEQMLRKGKITGLHKDDLCTPALLLDLDIFEANMKKMSEYLRSMSMGFRPHAKTHKCPQIAHRQMRSGANGICVATIAEAEVMARSGIKGLLITSEMVGRHKIERLMRLARLNPDIMVVVDNQDNAKDLNDAAAANRLKLNVLIDIDVGSRRTGLPPGKPAVELAKFITSCPNLTLRGLQGYAGHSSHVVGFEARRASSREAMAKAVETREMIQKEGIQVQIVSGGSTGTYNIDSEIGGVTELQVGSYVVMDIDYRRIGGKNGEVYDDFGCALTVLATVISRPYSDLAVVDAGFKAFSTDRPFGPEAKDITGIVYKWGGDEHGRLELVNPSRDIKLGDRIEFIVPHCDPTVNLYDRIYGVRGDRVEVVWPVMDRLGNRSAHF